MADTTRLVVNGTGRRVPCEPDRSLLVVLREELGLTGAKYGCGEGACGACTVLLDGEPVRSCTVPLAEADDRSVTTVEGLPRDGHLHPVQRAFVEAGAMQCGYCTAGMVMAATASLARDPHPDDDAIVDAMNGNVCRCCTYPSIVRAIRRAAELLGSEDGWAWELSPMVAQPWVAARPRRPWDLASEDDWDPFEVLEDGLLVVLGRDETPGWAWSTSGGAMVHVAGDGTITAFAGKVDVGQDNRTALSLLVAEELAAPLERVRIVLGDTDLSPFDLGTFGSRSMADAGTVLGIASTAARRALIGLAAGRWGVMAAELLAADGAVRERVDGGRAVGYADLVRGLRRVERVTAHVPLVPPAAWRTAGAPTTKVTALDAVTGRLPFTSDLTRPGMAHGAVLRPPAFGARLHSVRLDAAAAIPGVEVVHEDEVVGVVSADVTEAQRAVRAIEAEWDLRPQPSERDLVEHLRANPVEAHGWEGASVEETGDVDRALDAADVCLSATYTTAYIAHVPLETRVAVAEWEGDRLTVLTGTQRPFGVRAELSEALDVPEELIRVIVPPTGSAFGGKHTGEAAVEAARLARATGRPVKVRWSREEEFTWGYFRPAAVIDVRSGALADGALTAWEFTNVNSGAAGIGSPYDIPNSRIRYQPAASPLRQGSYRALAATANHFARESHLDELAHALRLDPLELRLRHLSDERLAEVLRHAADAAGWPDGSRSSEPGCGIGIAGGVEKDGYVATAAEVRVADDGSVRVERIVTAYDCGAVVNPDNLVNQIEGATVMGLGGALFETIHFEDGRIVDPRLSEYRVPRFADVPAVEVVLVDRRDVPPAGAGETPIVAVAPAIANAVFDATGVRLRSMPLVPDHVSRS